MGSGLVSPDQRGSEWLAALREMVDGLPAAVAYLAGPDHVIEFVNDEYQQLVGFRPVLGRPVRDALPELAAQGRIELLDKVIESGEPVRGHETELWLGRSGTQPEQVFVDVVYQPVRDAGNSVVGMLVFAADVTSSVRDRLRPEQLSVQLADSQDRYRTLFETLPQGVIHYAADGLVLGANPAASRILGLDASELITWPLARAAPALHEDGSPYDPADFPVTVALRTGAVVSEVVMGVPHAQSGELRWLGVTAVPDAHAGDGRPQRAYAIFRDLTRERQAETRLRRSAELMSRLRDANVLGVVVNGEDHVHEANDAFLAVIGYSRDDLAAGRISGRAITAPEWVARDLEARQQLLHTGAFRPYEKEYVHRDGHRVPVLVGGAVLSHHPHRWVTYVVDLSARQRAEQERVTLLTRERAARAEAQSTREQLDFLLRAGDFVAAARDQHELLRHASRLVVHSMADFCIGFLPTGDGELHFTSAAYRGPSHQVLFANLGARRAPAAAGRMARAVYAGSASHLLAAVTDLLAEDLPAPLREILTQVNPANILFCPLLAGGRALGVLGVARTAGRPDFAATDIAVVEELARQVGTGLANAAMFARDHTVAATLQRSVLPPALPDIDGLDLAVRYLPGTEGVDVGGDWYDAFPLPGNRVGLVIGDVVGHNIIAASVMGQLRNMLRVYATDYVDPPDVLRRTAVTLARLLPEALATVVYAVLDPVTGELRYANAGHPPPVCSTGSGIVQYLDDAPGVMLGAPSGAAFPGGHRKLSPGSSVLFYTDGLIEDRRRDITEGFRTLASAMRRASFQTAAQTCAAAQAALLTGDRRADDVCLLAARLTDG